MKPAGANLRTFAGDTYMVNSCTFSPDGTLVVSANLSSTLEIWDVATGNKLRTLKGHTDDVNGCAFSPDGAWIASASKDKTLKIWNAANGTVLCTVLLHGALLSIGVHPWQPQIVCGDSGGNLFILDLAGIKYGSIIVTATETRVGLVIRCPSCKHNLPIFKDQLGSELTCSTPGCGLRLKINPFVIQMA